MNNKSLPSLRLPLRLIMIFLLLTIGIIISGYLYYKNEKTHIRKTKFEELSAIADLKATRIANWKLERFRDAEDISEAHIFAKSVRKYIESPEPSARDAILDRLTSLKENNDYKKILLADTRGQLVLSTDRTDKTIERHALSLITDAINKKRILFHDLHQGDDPDNIHLSLITPLIEEFGESRKVTGIIVYYIDPRQFLYQLIQSWPTPSRTAEVMLIRHDGDEAVILNDLRHRKNSALSLRIPSGSKLSPAAMAVRGDRGIFEGFDYRGIPVLSAIKEIPGLPWVLVAKVDTSEVFSPIRKAALTVIFFVLLMTGASGLCVGFLWRHQRAEHYKSQFDAEIKHSSLLQRYEYISKYANDIILQLDLQGNVLDANERALQSYGFTHEELMNMNIRDLRHPETLDSVENDLSTVKNSNGFIFETAHKRKDGTTFPVEVSSRLITADHIKAYVSIIRDITQRKENEKVIKDREESFRNLSHQFNALLDAIPDDITLLSPDLRIIWANKTAQEKIGNKAAELRQKPCYKLRHGRSTPCDNCPVPVTFSTGKPQNDIVETVNGIWDMRTAPIFDSGGRITSVINIARDITEHRKLEEQFRHSQKLEGIGQLAGGVAHDFNNILSAILGYASLLQMEMEQDNPLRLNVEQILAATDRATVLTQSLLAFSRKQIIDLKPVDLNAVIRSIEKLLIRIIGEDIELRTMLTEGRIPIIADTGQLDQVLMNLTTNSRDAMPAGGLILIEADAVEITADFIKTHGYGKAGHYARISFTDTGTGMDEMTRERIFEPFFTTKEVGKGTGLGLSMVFGIIKQHNGFINCYSELKKGTTFRIYLPLIRTEDEEYASDAVHAPPVLPRGTETVLVAEDDHSLRKLTRTVLTQFGYTVIEAADGEEAVQRYLENKDAVKLLVLDVVMPKKNGKEAYEEIHALYPAVKAIFLSGYTANLIHRKGILAEGIDFIMKPVTPVDLLMKVREVLDR